MNELKMKTADHLSSSLPAVLKQYLPDYEPTLPVKPQDPITPRNRSPEKVSDRSRSPGKRSSSKNSNNDEGFHQRSSSPGNGQNKRRQSSETERLEKLSLKWDIAKNDVRQDQHQLLKDKVLLQQQLIKKQDALAQAKREELEKEAQKQRELEKAKKQAKESALLQQCKNSIEEDRKSASKERKSKAKAAVTTPPTPSSTGVPSSPVRTPSKSRRFHPNLPPVSRTPTNTELLERDPSWSMPEGEPLPWHQKQLYQVLGKGADYFLHPKIEKKAVKPINSKLRKEGGKRRRQETSDSTFDPLGRAGVERLLKTLRDESQIRLLKADAHIPQELKDTFGAFVRESVGKDRPPVQRFFCAEEDVPELARLQDHSKSARVRHYKHKTDLMFRASKNNEDRTNILIHNNPPPEVASVDPEEDGVGRYLPSWIDDLAESEPDYMKWVTGGKQSHRDLTSQPIKEDEEEPERQEEERAEEFTDEVILQMSRRKHHKPQPKYIFIKDEDTNFKGTFTDKFRDMYDNADIPRPFNANKLPSPTKSKSVLGLTTEDMAEDDRPSCQSAPIPSRHRRYYDYVSQWEPLSMNALIEYTKKKEAEGAGEFNQGRPKMWTNQVKVT